MPIRNFYIACEIDGRKSRLTGGPKAKDGGFNLIIYQRSNGRRIIALEVVGVVRTDARLQLEILKNDNTFMVSSIEDILITNR